jgi:tetratricopeptide (TPR) repeat protein
VLTIVTDPRDVAAAVFPGERNRGLDSQGSEYVSARQGIGNMRHELENRLRASAGKLLVTGPAGIGKTREVAELARDLCATNWKILVVKDEGDPRLGPLLDLPPALVDAKVLVVVDRLHYRIRTAGEQSIAPYAERLALFLGWLNDKLRGGVSVLATARDEPRYQPDLDLGRHQMTWRGFGVFRLPPLTDEGLHQLLMTLAARVNLAVSADEASRLIANSDRRPGTVVINIERAIQLGSRLKDEWRPTEGETWGLRLHSAREESAGVDQVWHAVHLLTEAGLPARANYVASVARALGVDNPEVAVAVLDGNALLGLESGVVTPHSPEQLSELIGALGAPHKSLTDVADHLERAIAEQPDRSTQAHDLLALATGLAAAGQPARGDQVATRAIELLTGGGELMESSLGTSQLARAYRTRAGIRFGLAHLAGVEADLSQVLAQSGEDADTYFLRAATRNLNNDFEGALLDLDAAIRLGRDNREVHEQRATAFHHLGRWSDVAASLGAAFERGTTSGSAWYILAVARMQLRDAAGAEQAFTSALERGVGLPSPKELAALQRAPLATPGDNERDAHGSDSIAYALRAVARAVLRKYEAAEQDVTAALEGGAAASLNSLQVALQGGSVPLIARAAALLEGFDTRRYEGALYQLRGRTRLAQGRLAEAVADFDEALAHGYTDGEVYVARAEARFRMGTPDAVAGAEEDASAAIAQGKAHAPTYLLRGLTRLARERFPEAEQDFDAAIDLSGETAPLLEWRGNARMRQQRLPDADSDFTRALEFGATATARFQRGCVRHDLGRYQEAEADLTAALGGGFSPPGLYTIRGLARLAQGNLAGAEEDVTAAFAAGAGDMYTYSLRGALRLEREQPADAVADFNEAIRLGRDDVAIHFERGRALHGLQRYAEAEQAFDTVIGLGGNDANVFTNRGRARWLQRKAALAEADFVAAIDLGRDDAPVHFSLGRARADLGRYREAELDLTRSLDREDAFYVRAERGRVRLLRGNAGAAEDDLTVALAASGPDPGACVNRALARYAQGRIADSLPDFDDALKLAPGALPILVHRVMAHVRLGNLDLAAADCERMAAAAEDDPDTIGAVGILRLGHADVVGAVDRFAQAAARDSSWHRWHGLGLLLSGSPEQAREAYRRETDAAPIDYAVSLAELDFYLEQLGDRVSPRPTPTVVADIRTELSKAATRDI